MVSPIRGDIFLPSVENDDEQSRSMKRRALTYALVGEQPEKEGARYKTLWTVERRKEGRRKEDLHASFGRQGVATLREILVRRRRRSAQLVCAALDDEASPLQSQILVVHCADFVRRRSSTVR